MKEVMCVNQVEYEIIKLLGNGKGGYSYLARRNDKQYVLKQIHHEPCDYYTFGNKIEFYPEKLIFMSIDQKIKMVELLSPTGSLFENEKRTIFGLMPSPELEGKRLMSLNWINANDASQYQVGKNASVEIVDEEKEDI